MVMHDANEKDSLNLSKETVSWFVADKPGGYPRDKKGGHWELVKPEVN